MVTTRGDLKTQIRQRLNYENNTNIKDTELNSYINFSAGRLYAIICLSNEDYYTKRMNFSITSSEALEDGYLMPLDCWRIVRIDRVVDSSNTLYYSLDRTNLRDENLYNPYNSVGSEVSCYHSEVNTDGYTEIRIFPQTNKTGNYRILYNPPFIDYTSDGQFINMGPPGQHWEEYIVLDVCSKLAVKTETDPTPFIAAKVDLETHIRAEGAAREAGQATPPPRANGPWYDKVMGNSRTGWR